MVLDERTPMEEGSFLTEGRLNPGEMSVGDTELAPNPTLEEEAEQLFAPGSDIPLPEGLGEHLEGKTVADLYTQHTEAERKISELSEEIKALRTAPREPTPEQNEVTEFLQPFADKFAENQTLEAEDVQKISKKTGFPETYVNAYLQGQLAVAQLAAQEILSVTGGEELIEAQKAAESNYAAMLDWVNKELDESSKREFEKALQSNNVDTMRFAVSNLWDRFQAAGGGPPTRRIVGRGTDTQGGVEPYETWAQVIADQGKPEYQTDEAFRQKVYRRLAVSNL